MSALIFFIRFLGGAVGGNLMGELFRNLSLGFWGNSITGVIGGLIGGYCVWGVLGAGVQVDFALGNVFASLLGGTIGGGLATAVGGWLKGADRIRR